MIWAFSRAVTSPSSKARCLVTRKYCGQKDVAAGEPRDSGLKFLPFLPFFFLTLSITVVILLP